MLNYIWFGLLAIGILVAIGNDVYDETANPYRNGVPLSATLAIQKVSEGNAQTIEGSLHLSADQFNSFYGVQSANTEVQNPITITTSASGEKRFALPISEHSPKLWRDMTKGAASKEKLGGLLSFGKTSDVRIPVLLEFEQIHFIKMKSVTQSALDIAGVAVTLAFGLIGIMALWLGVMKVAEEAGLLRVVARVLSPVMKRLFPDVPSDHPAVGAMIMNIAANMLGLSNAATPLGLKAMEELNKLNSKPGIATNAMVTFLAINTGGLILVPATAIAVRASVGSLNPGLIIGTSIVGAGCATAAGILAAKLLQRLPMFKKDSPAPLPAGGEVSNG